MHASLLRATMEALIGVIETVVYKLKRSKNAGCRTIRWAALPRVHGL